MFSGNKTDTKIDLEQHELMEHAQKRIRQKKQLYRHFVIFLIGCVFLILVNKVLGYGAEYDWYLWGILAWLFFLILHLVNVYLFKTFMGQEWERKQREHLVQLQKKRISEIQKEIETDFPLTNINKKKEL